MLGTRTLCVVTAAPFECSFSPKGADVGGQALRLVVTDKLGSDHGALRDVVVSRFVAKLSVSVAKQSVKGGIRRTITGKVSFPSAVTQGPGLPGKVLLTIKRAGRSVLNQEVQLSKRLHVLALGHDQGAEAVLLGLRSRSRGNTVLNTAGTSRRFS